jgi:hypothetical protein
VDNTGRLKRERLKHRIPSDDLVTVGDYASAVQHSAELYVADLERMIARGLSEHVARLASATVETTRAALRDRRGLKASEVSLNLGLVRVALDADAEGTLRLLNQAALGLGTPAPDVLFIGKEAAYDVRAAINFLLESIALTMLWLCNGSQPVISALLGQGVQCDFLREPASMPLGTYRAVRSKGGHMWRKIGSVLKARLGQEVDFETWGKHAYLVELGVVPSTYHKGKAPNRGRVRFLKGLVGALANSGARTLVLHSREPHHADAQADLAAAFLGVDRNDLNGVHRWPLKGATPATCVETWDARSRRVVRCRNLSNSISGNFLREIAALIL